MHSASFVVTVCDRTRKALREYNHSRISGKHSETTVIVPFDAEYQFGFKVLDDDRRRLTILIDGVEAVKDLVVSGPGMSFLERFLENDRRFKFARLSNSGVADPSNPDNGGIEIRVWREVRRPAFIVPQDAYVKRPKPCWDHGVVGLRSFTKGVSAEPRTYGVAPDLDAPRSMSFGPDGCGSAPDTLNLSCSVSNSATMDCTFSDVTSRGIMPQAMPTRPRSRKSIEETTEAGATIEGSKSYQNFGDTTWAGDADPEPDVFIIHLRGKQQEAEPPKVSATKVMLCSCGATSPLGSKFCCNCGGRF